MASSSIDGKIIAHQHTSTFENTIDDETTDEPSCRRTPLLLLLLLLLFCCTYVVYVLLNSAGKTPSSC